MYRKDDHAENKANDDLKIDKNIKEKLIAFAENLFIPLSRVLLFTSVCFFFTIVCFVSSCASYIDYLFSIAEWFNLDSASSYFTKLYNDYPIIISSIIVSIIFAYLYILAYMAQNRQFMFNKTGEGQKYISFILYFYEYFLNCFIVPFILFPFLFFKFLNLDYKLSWEGIKKIFEILCIIFIYYVTNSWFVPITNCYEKVSRSYEYIDKLNEAQKYNTHQIMIEMIERFVLIYNYKKSKKESKKDIEKVYNELVNKSEKFLMGITRIILKTANMLQKAIIILLIFLSIMFWFLKFNLLTILYAILTLTIWYMAICHIQDIPTNKANIYLTNNEKIKDVYIIEDNPEDYILVLDKDNKITKIMKGSIIKIEYKKP